MSVSKPPVSRRLPGSLFCYRNAAAILSGPVFIPGIIDLGVPIFYMYSKELSIHSVKLAPYSFPRALQILPKLGPQTVDHGFSAGRCNQGIRSS